MATPGFGGKILLVDLTTKEITRLDTDQYAMYGVGMVPPQPYFGNIA